MLKRLFTLLAAAWAAAFLANGSTRATGIMPGDVALALAPLAIGWVVVRGARFVATGSFRRLPAYRVYKP